SGRSGSVAGAGGNGAGALDRKAPGANPGGHGLGFQPSGKRDDLYSGPEGSLENLGRRSRETVAEPFIISSQSTRAILHTAGIRCLRFGETPSFLGSGRCPS